MGRGIEEREGTLIQTKDYFFRLAGLKEHFEKALKFLDRARNFGMFFPDVELGNFSSCTLSGIRHVKAHFGEVAASLSWPA